MFVGELRHPSIHVEVLFIEDPCVQCGNPVKDSGPSHCNRCARGPFCVSHLQAHLYIRETNGGCPIRC